MPRIRRSIKRGNLCFLLAISISDTIFCNVQLENAQNSPNWDLFLRKVRIPTKQKNLLKTLLYYTCINVFCQIFLFMHFMHIKTFIRNSRFLHCISKSTLKLLDLEKICIIWKETYRDKKMRQVYIKKYLKFIYYRHIKSWKSLTSRTYARSLI